MAPSLISLPIQPMPARSAATAKQRLNFEVTDAIVLCQTVPRFFHWNADTETLKLRRRDILEELNAPNGKGEAKAPVGMRIFEETKSHVR